VLQNDPRRMGCSLITNRQENVSFSTGPSGMVKWLASTTNQTLVVHNKDFCWSGGITWAVPLNMQQCVSVQYQNWIDWPKKLLYLVNKRSFPNGRTWTHYCFDSCNDSSDWCYCNCHVVVQHDYSISWSKTWRTFQGCRYLQELQRHQVHWFH